MATDLHLSDRDVAEASCVTSKGSGHQFEIQLGHLCNNRCVFCSSGQLTQLRLARHIPLEPIVKAIEDARALGARRVTFVGGEPTLHKGFVAALARAVELGFEEIVIFTNGVLFPHPGFIDRVVALGSFEWRVSIQGGNEEAHVAVTARKDSFRRIVEGLVMLRERGQRVTANMCVNEQSYRSLPDYPSLMVEHDIRQLHVDIIRPASAGARTDAYLREIMPRYSVIAPYVARMLEEFDRVAPSFDVNVGNLPFCILPVWAHRIHHGGEETITTACDPDGLEVEVDKYTWHTSQRRHLPACERCVFRAACTGIFKTYLDIHGEDEFQPVSIEALRALDAEHRHFALIVAPALAPLVAAAGEAAPEGWSFAGADRALGSVSLRFCTSTEASTEGGATLQFTPPGPRDGRGDGVMLTDMYDLSVAAEPGVGADALGRLLAWTSTRLAQAPGMRTDLPLDPIAAVERILRPRALLRGRARVRHLVARVQSRGRFGVFRYTGERREADQSVLELRAPGGDCIEIVLAIAARAGRSQVSLDVRLGEGTDVRTARPVVEEVVRALRD